jgi:SAM-dependent methyltransferase
MAVDFGRTADDYATHRAGFPDSIFDRLAAFGAGLPGQVVVDLGTGTGTLARGLARRGCGVIGIDPSADMLDQARALAAGAGPTIDFRVGRAEATGLPDASADVVTAGQCWHWFDRPAAAVEVRRVLRPGGVVAVCHFDWLPHPGSAAAATEALILEHNPAWRGAGSTGMYPRWAADLAGAGFASLETFSYDVDVPYTHDAWRGRVRASAGVAASLAPDAVARFDDALGALLDRDFPEDPLAVAHRVWALVGRAPGA